MNRKKLRSLPALWLTMACALIMSSCSNDNKLLESVPFDADFVATFNIIELAKQSGITIEDSRIVLPDGYGRIRSEIPAEVLEQAGKWAEAIDLESVLLFGDINSNDYYATAFIKDADKLRGLIKDNGYSAGTKNGTEIYSNTSNCFAFDNSADQIWFLDTRRIDKLDEFELARKKNNITRYSGLTEALNRDNVANLVMDQSALGTGSTDMWSAFSINITDNAIAAEVKMISTDGEVFSSGALRPVDTDFLRYIPANFICAAAVGINPGSDWVDQTGKMVDLLGGGSDRRMFAEIAPYLKALDGTVAVGFGPKNKGALLNPMSPDRWQFILMAHMTRSKINELTEVMRSNLPGSTELSGGMYQFTSRELQVNYGSINGNFAIGMGIDLKPDKQNSFTSDFNGKSAGLVFQTPMLNTIIDSPEFAYSIKAKMECDEGITRLKINLIGTDSPIVPTLISTLPEFVQQFERKARGY